MFTGIIEEIGQIQSVSKNRVSAAITIKAHSILQDVAVGDSIAVNGICLTVTGYTKDRFTVDMMHETFDRTCANVWKRGTKVNLERAMAAGGRFGGHIVSGHIDGTGTISGIRQDDNAVWYEITADPRILRYVVEKGSIAIDGISLTVATVGKDCLAVNLYNLDSGFYIFNSFHISCSCFCFGRSMADLLSTIDSAVKYYLLFTTIFLPLIMYIPLARELISVFSLPTH